MKTSVESKFNAYYAQQCKHLKLKGLQPKTIEAYSRAIRRIGGYFNGHVDDLTQNQLLDYFSQLLEISSWSTVKLDLYGLKFFYTHVLKKNGWIFPSLNLLKQLVFLILLPLMKRSNYLPLPGS